MRLLERDAELVQLNKLFEDAGAGHGHVVLIRGEAGMGKTSLVREFMASVEGSSHSLVGVCDDLLAQRPLAAIRDMSLEEPELATAIEAGTSTVYSTVMTLLGRALRPTLMVIEDVHWADDATLDLIRHVGRRIGDSHAILILTYRDEDVTTDHPLRSILSDLPAKVVDRIILQPLSRAAIETLAADKGGNIDRAYYESGGNPFLATELLDSRDGVIPASIVESIAGRMGRLRPPTRGLAELVSVVPGRTPLELIKNVSADWSASLDEAEQRGVLVLNPANVSFRHELARRAVETNLTAAKRIELNAIALDYMLQSPLERARIIHHAANAGNTAVLLEFSPVAGREAIRVGSNSQAVQYFETLRHHYGQLAPRERALFLEDWSYAAHVVDLLHDAMARSEEAVAIWRDLEDAEGLGRSLRWTSRLKWLAGRNEAAKAAADEAAAVLESIEVTSELAYAYSAQAQLKMLSSEDAEAIVLAKKAIEVARQVGNDMIAAHAMVNLGSALVNHRIAMAPQEPPELAALEDAIAFAERVGFWDEVARGSVNMAWAGLGIPDLALAETYARQTIEVCDDHELPSFRHYAVGTLADVMRLRGEWEDAEDLAREFLSQAHMWATSEILNRSVLGSILVRRGDPEATEHLDRAWELAYSTGEAQRTIPVSIARAELAWLATREGEAKQILRDEIDRVKGLNPAWVWSDLIFTAFRMGVELPDPLNVRDPYRAAIFEDAETAADSFLRSELPYEAALTLLRGDQGQAVRGISILDRLGATVVAARARADLRASGVANIPRRPKTPQRPGPSGLTERQLEVMALISEGLTNPEIADRLFVSPRTVDHHVSAILNKLGVGTRQEATQAFSS